MCALLQGALLPPFSLKGEKETMKRIELTPRLQAVASFVPKGARLADIGTDHAYLPVSLILDEQIPGAVAADLRPGPLDRARKTAAEYGCTDKVTFRLCDGLSDVKSYETDVIAIAGMGGETISDILSAARWVKGKNLPVIMQPMSSQPELRRWLWKNGYDIQAEKLVREGDTIYVVIRARAGECVPMSCAEEWAGRQYQGMEEPLRTDYLNGLLDKVNWALQGLSKSKEGCRSPRYQEMELVREGLEQMREEWLQWQL